MNFHNNNHPIWSIIRVAVIMMALLAILALTAQHFDSTEVKTLVWTFAAIAGLEGGINYVTRKHG